MAELVISNLSQRFGTVLAVADLSLRVADGEFLTLLGPSGCGKSTTLGAIAGLERPTAGRIEVGTITYFDSAKGVFLPPERRKCGLVFQSYALWPHMTVFDNVAFPLSLRRTPKSERKRRIEESLALVEMDAYAARYPHQLSGGQQQRVALARTLVYRPEILLLDEPLSNLDAKLRDRARTWLAELRTRLGLTTIYVTHDQVEALALSDRVVVMKDGRIAQVGTPQEIYERPAEPFVADFIGTTNFLTGVAESAHDGWLTVVLKDGQRVVARLEAVPPGGTVTLAYRPEQIRVAHNGLARDDETLVAAEVFSRAYVGGRWQNVLRVGGERVRIETEQALPEGRLQLGLPLRGAIVFQGAADARSV